MLGLGLSIPESARRAGGGLAPPIVADQPAPFGQSTRAGAGGFSPVNSGGAITSASIDSGSTNATSHWQISAAGVITPTSAGVTAVLANTPYTLNCTFTGPGGADTATITITCEANALDVISASEIAAAWTHVKTGLTTVWKIYVRDGHTIGVQADRHLMTGGVFTATINSDGNAAATPATYDREAVAAFGAGGLVHFTCRTAYAGKVDGALEIIGSTGILITNLDFIRQDDVDNDDTGYSSAGSTKQLIVTANGSFPTMPNVVIRGNRFGCYTAGVSDKRWIVSIDAAIGALVVVEDNEFDGFLTALNLRALVRGVARRNRMRHANVDYITLYPALAADAGTADLRFEVTDNDFWAPTEAAHWEDAHADCIQIGDPTDTVNRDLLFAWNYGYVPHIHQNTQGQFQNGYSSSYTVSGDISYNFFGTGTLNGLTIHHVLAGKTLNVDYNTIVTVHLPGTDSGGNAGGANAIRFGNSATGDHEGAINVRNNIVGKITDTTRPGTDQDFTTDGTKALNDGGAPVLTNNGRLSQMTSSGAGSFPTELNGTGSTFAFDATFGWAPATPPRTDTSVNFRADIDALYGVDPTGAQAGRGHRGNVTPANARIVSTGNYRIVSTGNYRKAA